ncbi:hypothetical protein DTO271G3_6801 [Paecilomyces variotii]|nr:hypothetical protein DTO271G3_6801 [Paecilomyces variotii]
MGSAVSVCLAGNGWHAGLALFCFVRFWNVPRRDPSRKTGCWLRRFLFFLFFFLKTSTTSTKALRPERAVVVETHFLCLVQCARSVCHNEETRRPSSMLAEKTQEIGQRTSQARNKIVVLSGTGEGAR